MDERIAVRGADDPAWHRLIGSGALFFTKPDWLAVLDAGFRGRPAVPCLLRDGEVVAALPAYLFRAGPFRILHAGVPYGALLGEVSDRAAFWGALRSRRSVLPADQLRIAPLRPAPGEPDWAPVVGSRMIAEVAVAGLSEDEIWRGLPAAAQRNVRAAERQGVRVRRATGGDAGERMFALYAETLRRKGAVRRYTSRYFAALAEHPAATILIAEIDDAALGAVALLGDGPVVHYLHAGSNERGRAARAGDLLVWEALAQAARDGRAALDLGASDPDDEGLRAFKRKWGGVERTGDVRLVPVRRIRSALAELARRFRR